MQVLLSPRESLPRPCKERGPAPTSLHGVFPWFHTSSGGTTFTISTLACTAIKSEPELEVDVIKSPTSTPLVILAETTASPHDNDLLGVGYFSFTRSNTPGSVCQDITLVMTIALLLPPPLPLKPVSHLHEDFCHSIGQEQTAVERVMSLATVSLRHM